MLLWGARGWETHGDPLPMTGVYVPAQNIAVSDLAPTQDGCKAAGNAGHTWSPSVRSISVQICRARMADT